MIDREKTIKDAMQIDGLIDENELVIIYDLLHNREIQIILEIGAYKGRSTSLIHSLQLYYEHDEYYVIDTFGKSGEMRPEYERVDIDEFQKKFKVTIIEGNSKNIYLHKDLDFVFIDGDHTQEGIYNDLCKYLPQSELILIHDSKNPEVQKGVKKYEEENDIKFEGIESANGFYLYDKTK